jgi:2-dehydro-3-deoxygluconokinase
VLPFIDRCDLLLAGAAELGELLGEGDGGSDAREIARRAMTRGPKEVVVRGAACIGVLTADGWEQLEIRRDAAVDPIGAGDAFNAGYLAVRLRGGTIADALRAGARCGAAVTSAPSDTAGFPRSL